MKKTSAKLLCLLLAIVTFASSIPAHAESGGYTDPENHWAYQTLLRAAADGLVSGGAGLNPDGAVSRAQAAVMINRILGADRAADLTGKTDVPKSAWYYGDMAKAVFLGYLTVPKVALMTRAMTRQEMFAVLSGAFCLNRAHPGEAALSRFSDVSAMAGAFRVSAESLCQAGFLAGSNESLRPNERATRAEFLTLLYKITDSLKIVGCDKTIVELNAGESAVLRCGVLKSVSAPGSCGTVVFAQDTGDVRFGAAADEVIAGSGTGEITLTGKIKQLDVTGAGKHVIISGSADTVYLSAGATVTIDALAQVGTLCIQPGAKGCGVIIDGTTDKLIVSASGCTISGTGRVNSFDIQALENSISICPGGYSRLSSAVVDLTAPEILPAGEKLTVTASIKNASVGGDTAYVWSADGTKSDSGSASLSGGAEINFSPVVEYAARMADAMTIGFALTYSCNGALEYRYSTKDIRLENYPLSHYYGADAGRVQNLVTTYQYPTTVRRDSYLCQDCSLKTHLRLIKAGTPAICTSSIGFSAAQITLSDGTVGWISYGSIANAAKNCTRAEDYNHDDKEIWVNVRQYTSATDYLVWVSLSCQKVNVFEKSADGWTLCKVMPCASGANSTPTPTGVYAVSYHQPKWDYGSFWCGPVTGFEGGYAFHSWLRRPDGSAYDLTMGQPVSHGCIRMEDAGAQYMYALPMQTRVIIF